MRDFPLNALMETRTSLPDLCALFCAFLIAFLAVLGDQENLLTFDGKGKRLAQPRPFFREI